MGNGDSKESKHVKVSYPSKDKSPQERFFEARFGGIYDQLIEKYKKIDKESFKSIFGEELQEVLWNYYSSPPEDIITKERYINKTEPFYNNNNKIWKEIFPSPESFIKHIFLTAKIEEKSNDKQLIDNIISIINKTSINDFIQCECPRMHYTIQHSIINSVDFKDQYEYDFSSNILTPFQMFIVNASINPIIFNNKDLHFNAWTKLYDSTIHGVSVNRFENNIFDYKKPTITILKFHDGSIFVIALDQEWRNSVKNYGGNNTSVIQIKPTFKKEDKPDTFYCNLKLKSAPQGVMFGKFLQIDSDFSNIDDIEVWGVGDEEDLIKQKKQKLWYKQEADKRRKVPLPGMWDENPDKVILEMGGIKLHNERRDFDRPDDTIARKF
uniref:TLDc domain-containing protein n=1 Tax=Parastrongyloides trichosuri TaxID=131310 RepID=A0A0N4ZY37_PARTI